MIVLNENRTLSTFSDYAREFFLALHGRFSVPVQTSIKELGGGFDSFGVARVRAQFEFRGFLRSATIVLKKTPAASPEARLHSEILPAAGVSIGPPLLGLYRSKNEHVHIFGFIRPVARWPWPDLVQTRLVLQSLAELHRKEISVFRNDTDYDDVLKAETLRLFRLFETVSPDSPVAFTRKYRRLIMRIAAVLPQIRRELFKNQIFASTLIHGDVHSGNVIMQRKRGVIAPVFVDWGRSRHGSPLEDVSSWLQSLGFWEPEAKRRHDALLRYYLLNYRGDEKLTGDVRALYWAAAACNVLAGAAIYHFSVAEDSNRRPKVRDSSVRSLVDCIRVLRRADAYWTS